MAYKVKGKRYTFEFDGPGVRIVRKKDNADEYLQGDDRDILEEELDHSNAFWTPDKIADQYFDRGKCS